MFPPLLLMGLATRFSAAALLVMMAVIQVFVYLDAHPTRGTWAAILLLLVARGAGEISLDHFIAQRWVRLSGHGSNHQLGMFSNGAKIFRAQARQVRPRIAMAWSDDARQALPG